MENLIKFFKFSWYKYKIKNVLFFYFLTKIFIFFVKFRIKFYKFNFFFKYKINIPILIIGNLTLGGSGKTPFAIYIINILNYNNFIPTLITKGYKSFYFGPLSVYKNSLSYYLGDEAVEIKRNIFSSFIVGSNKIKNIEYLLFNYYTDLIIFDDGIQSYYLERDIEIIILDGLKRFGNQFNLPLGPLRENISRFNKSTFYIISNIKNKSFKEFSLIYKYLYVYNNINPHKKYQICILKNIKLYAISGIEHPDKFFNILKYLNLNISKHYFSDHYNFNYNDLKSYNDFQIITTEKDMVKCETISNFCIWCVKISIENLYYINNIILRKCFYLKKNYKV